MRQSFTSKKKVRLLVNRKIHKEKDKEKKINACVNLFYIVNRKTH